MSDVEVRLGKIRKAIDKIVEHANADGILTNEEEAIIKTAKENLKTYEALVEQALEDGIITQEEKNALIDLEEQLMSDTYFVALEDGRVDKDELLLLKTLIKTMDAKASVSWLDEDVS